MVAICPASTDPRPRTMEVSSSTVLMMWAENNCKKHMQNNKIPHVGVSIDVFKWKYM